MKRTVAIIVTTIVVALSFTAIPDGLAAQHMRAVVQHSDRTPAGRALDMGITIYWTHTPCGHAETEWGGCYDIRQPNIIEIAIADGSQPEFADYAILHELSHVRQYRAGEPRTECGADENAARWGALFSGYNCPGLLSYDDWLNGAAAPGTGK